jgi:hypothetical protein
VKDPAALIHWSVAELAAAAAVLHGVVRAWAADWGVRLEPAEQSTCGPAKEDDISSKACPLGSSAVGAAWRIATCGTALGHRLFSRDVADGSLAAQVVEACERDAWVRIRNALDLRDDRTDGFPPLANLCRAWAGTARVNLPLGLCMLLTAPLVNALLKEQGVARAKVSPARDALIPVREALANTSYPVQVQLDGCEIDMGALSDLQVGDVLRIRHSLDAPAAVLGPGEVALFQGYLARCRGRRAIELAPRSGAQPSSRSIS